MKLIILAVSQVKKTLWKGLKKEIKSGRRSTAKWSPCIYISRRIQTQNVTARFCRSRGWGRWVNCQRSSFWEHQGWRLRGMKWKYPWNSLNSSTHYLWDSNVNKFMSNAELNLEYCFRFPRTFQKWVSYSNRIFSPRQQTKPSTQINDEIVCTLIWNSIPFSWIQCRRLCCHSLSVSVSNKPMRLMIDSTFVFYNISNSSRPAEIIRKSYKNHQKSSWRYWILANRQHAINVS